MSDSLKRQLVCEFDRLLAELNSIADNDQTIDYTIQLGDILSILQSIDVDTTQIENALSGISANTQGTVSELQNAVVLLQQLILNTDTVEQALTDILSAIPVTTTEAYGNEVLAAGESFTFPASAYSIRVTPEPNSNFDLTGLDEDITAWTGILGWGTGNRTSSNSGSVTVTANVGRVLLHWEV